MNNTPREQSAAPALAGWQAELRSRVLPFVVILTVIYTAVFYLMLLQMRTQPLYDDALTYKMMVGGEITAVAFNLLASIRMPRRFWLSSVMVTLAVVLMAAADTIFYADSNFVGDPRRRAACCGVLHLLGLVILLAGMIIFLSRNHSLMLMRASLDLLLATMACGGLLFTYVVLPLINLDHPPLILFIDAVMPVGELFLLALVLLQILDSHGHQQLSDRVQMVAFILFVVSDVLKLFNQIDPELEIFFVLPLCPLSLMLIGIAGLMSQMRTAAPLVKSPVHTAPPSGVRRFLVIVLGYLRNTLPAILTALLLILAATRFRNADPLLWWGCLILLLLAVRQGVMVANSLRVVHELDESHRELNEKNLKLQQMHEQILHDARHDGLTQISNRREIERKMRALSSGGKPFGLMILDVDYFKRVNDTFGHQTGDQVLIEVATLLKQAIDMPGGSSGGVGRIGGDEFMLLLPGASRASLRAVQQRLLEAVHADSLLVRLQVTLSMGGAVRTHAWGRADPEGVELFRQADHALYAAKEAGRNCARLAPECVPQSVLKSLPDEAPATLNYDAN